jgi:hypothetical protein
VGREDRHGSAGRAPLSDLHLIVVDDRSRTAPVTMLARLAATNPRLSIVTVRELPPDWLGKSHALHVGAAANVATPLAPVHRRRCAPRPDALARAIDAAERTGTDHVSLLPTHRGTTFLGRACLLAFQLVVQRRVARRQRQPGNAASSAPARSTSCARCLPHDRRPPAAATRSRRRRLARLPAVPRRLPLACLVCRARLRNRLGRHPRSLVRVVEKNMFAMLRFRTWLAAILLALTMLVIGATFAGPWLAGTAGWLALGAYLLTALPAIALARRMEWNPLAGLLVPIARIWLPIALINSTLVTLRQGGVRWRGTFYALRQLRSGQVSLR